MGDRGVDGNSRAALREWIVDRFTVEELRMLVSDLYGRSVDLPVGVMSMGVFAFAVIDELERNGRIDLEFFDALARVRPAHAAEVDRIRELWHPDAESPMTSAPAATFEGPRGAAAAALLDFTGRGGPLAELERLLQANATECVVVSGIEGGGKSTLVQEFVARRGPERFSDGSAWLDGASLSGELTRVARRFGWNDERDPTPVQARALLQRELRGRRFLLVVDNVDADADTTYVPVPGGSCRTVVTSRKTTMHLDLRNAASLELEPWSEQESLEFLGTDGIRRDHDTQEERRALAAFVGHLPLGVRLVALMLRNRPGTAAADLLAQLQVQPVVALERHRGRFPGLAETFQATWDARPEADRRVLLALAVCANGTRTEVVTAVSGVADAAERLDDLAIRSLAQCAPKSATPWGVHDVVRMLLAADGSFAELAEAHLGWVRAHMAAHADPLRHAEFAACVSEARRAFTRALEREVDAATRVYAPLRTHLFQVGRWVIVRDLAEALLKRSAEGSAVRAMCETDLGRCYRNLGEVQRAIACHQRSLAIQEALGELAGQADELGELGRCHQGLSQLRTAIEYHEKALAIDERLGRLEEQANRWGNLGLCYRRLEELPRAIAYHERSLAVAEKLGRLAGQMSQLGSLGLCYRKLGEIKRAIEHHERSLDCARRLGSREGEASQLGNLGSCYYERKETRRAIEFHERSLALYQDISYLEGQANALGNLGVCYKDLGEVSRAAEFHQRSLAMNEKLCRLEGQANQLVNWADCQEALGELPRARELQRRALELYGRMGLGDEHPSVRTVRAALARPG